MESPFDVRTLMFVITIALICRAMVMGYVWQLDREYRPLQFWAIGSIMMATGVLLVGLREIVPLILSVFFGHVLLMTGWLTMSGGTLVAMGRRPPWKHGLALTAVALGFTYWFLLVAPDFGLRTLSVSLPVIVFDIYVAIACLRHQGDSKVTTFRMLAGLLLMLDLSNAVKSWHIFSTDSQLLFDPHWPVVQFYLFSVVSALVGTVLYVLLAMQTLQQKLDAELDERKRNEASLKLAALVYDNSSEAMIVTDAQANIIAVNPAFTALTGYNPAEVVGKNPRILKSRKQDAAFYKGMWDSLLHTGKWQGDIWNRHKDGQLFAERLTINTITDASGKAVKHVALFHDVTQEKISAETIFHQAHYDRLTELPNRYFFFEHFAKELSRARREHKTIGLLFMDLNRFKPVNDQYGHEAGDIVLKAVADRWKSCIRSSDVLARLGGDEFALIAGGLTSREETLLIAHKLTEALRAPIPINAGVTCEIGTSIGIAIYPEHGLEMDSLIAAADAAMYANKAAGDSKPLIATADMVSRRKEKTNWVVFDATHLTGIDVIDGQHLEIVKMVNNINRALHDNPSDEELKQLFQELVAYATLHFRTEQELMQRYDYPEAAQHRHQHARLEEEIDAIVSQFSTGAELRLLQTIKDWLVGHIESADKPLGAYLRSKGVH